MGAIERGIARWVVVECNVVMQGIISAPLIVIMIATHRTVTSRTDIIYKELNPSLLGRQKCEPTNISEYYVISFDSRDA